MFIVNAEPNREMKVLLRTIKKKMGEVPPHWEVFASINPERFKMFLDEINYLSTHENINPDFFALLRYYIASQNGFSYCYNFNQKLLLSRGYSLEVLSSFESSAETLPLDEKHQKLFLAVLVALNEPTSFTEETINELKTIGWSDADILDAVDHGAFLFKFSKILKAYQKA
jgi:hypothetical protein